MSDDLIKRKDAIKAFTFNSKGERIPFVDCDNFPVEFPLRYIVDTLVALLPADRPQGEWIDAEIPLECGGSMPIQVCNLCKTFYPLAYTGGGHRFCPNCGARMKGADDEC